MSSALNIGLSTGNVGIGNRSYNNQLIPASNGRINGVNITALNERTRASRASAEACVSSWVTRASAADNPWNNVTWASDLSLFVVVGEGGTGNRIATSPDGISWNSRTSPADNEWRSVIWAPELSIFVAVAASGTGNRVMTSINGITWTTRTSAADNNWISAVWASELSIFVAVAFTGIGNRVMTSPDGITWTTRASAADNQWISVTWASELSLFVAVAQSGADNRVMTSPNGITWTSQVSAANNAWRSVTWAPELSIFVAVALSGTGNRVMTSPNGITWTTRTSSADNTWQTVIWVPELSIFVAVGDSGTGNRIMTSPNGITWTARTSAADNGWYSVTWAPELSIFAAVAYSGTGNRVMTSAIGMPNSKSVVKALPSQMMVSADGNVGIGTTVPLANLHVNGNTILNSSLTMPNHVAFQVKTNANIFNGNTNIIIPFNTFDYTNASYNTSTYKFTAPSTGLYMFIINTIIRLSNQYVAGNVIIELMKNTSTVLARSEFICTGAASPQNNVDGGPKSLAYLTQGETVWGRATTNGEGYVISPSLFIGFRIS